MVTSSIERAQKKVEENNFGIRKRLLEYDNVMNSQREVIYRRRKNALFGERLKLDILTMFYDMSEELVNNAKAGEGYENFKLNVLSTFSIDLQLSEEDFNKWSVDQITTVLYDQALSHYEAKNKATALRALVRLKEIQRTNGATIENILVPFTDGTRQIGVVVNLQKAVESENVELVHAMEKIVSLAIIDQQWKEHLRDMDDLKQSVQNAVYEQKDPLLIYKFEGFEAFKRFVGRVNNETVSFLIKAMIPETAAPVQEARSQKRQRFTEQKDESRSLLSGGGQPAEQPRQQERVDPVKSDKLAGRNDKVSVQYSDGRVLKDVKYKRVEEDIKSGKCVVIG
jgi:preprotein translocase subunit SecA